MDAFAPGSPMAWLQKLTAYLDKRAQTVQLNLAYYRGDHPLPVPPKGTSAEMEREARKAFQHMTRLGVTNWVKLVADAPSERLEVVGFRFGEETGGDDVAWKIWQTNQLDADSSLVHDAALQTGQGFCLVWPDGNGGAEITPETPSQCLVAYADGSRRKRAAGLKRWQSDDGRIYATVYLPDAVYKFQSSARMNDATVSMAVPVNWEERHVPGEDWPLANPLGEVPLVEFRANADLEPAPFGGGTSEFDGVLTIQNRINKTIFDRLVCAEFQAFRQRYAIGWDVPTVKNADGSDTGEPDRAALARASASRYQVFPEGTTVGEFAQASFSDFIDSARADVEAMAAISKTPPDYLLASMDNIAAQTLQEANAKLVAKVRKHARNFGESWEEVLRLALKASDDPRASDMQSMILWGDMEHRTWAETVDAVLKMQALGVPTEELWARLPDVTPQDIVRWRALQAQDALFAPTPDAFQANALLIPQGQAAAAQVPGQATPQQPAA